MAIARLVSGIYSLAQMRYLQSFVFAHGFGHKKRAPTQPRAKGRINALCMMCLYEHLYEIVMCRYIRAAFILMCRCWSDTDVWFIVRVTAKSPVFMGFFVLSILSITPIPWTMPPVASSSSGSVTRRRKFRPSVRSRG